MKKRLWLILLMALCLGGCSLTPKKSAIEVDSYPVAKVYIDGKEMGMTPYRNRNLTPGEVEIKLVTNDKNWSKRVRLQNNINTVIDWEFGEKENQNGGYILYLEKTGDIKNAGLMVTTNPDKSTVLIDGEIKGLSPMRITNIGEGDRHLSLNFPGHKTVDVFMKSIKGYQLVVDANLAETNENINEVEEQATEATTSATVVQKIKIKETETGWLRVRETNSGAAKEVGRVNPEETYELMEENGEWVKINLGNGKSGWISSKYAEKI